MINGIIKDLKKGILCWYQFNKDSKVLCVMDKEHPVVELLKKRCEVVDVLDGDSITDGYDYIVTLGIIEYLEDPSKEIAVWKKLLNSNGKLIIGVENRLGLRYFCGDRDPHTGRNFDGIEGYFGVGSRTRSEEGRNFSKEEISNILVNAGFSNQKFYSILPNLEFTQLVYSEDFLPEEELAGRYFPKYNSPQTIFLDEERLYTDLINNNMFHLMANAYLIECPLNNEYSTTKHATISLERGVKQAMATVITNDDMVKKYPLYEEGLSKLNELKNNEQYLKERGVEVVEGNIEDDIYMMPFIKHPHSVTYLQKLFWEDRKAFEDKVDEFYKIIIKSSSIIREDDKLGPILERGYIDLVPLNSFYINGEFVFYDQEFYYDEYPAKVMLYRTINILYSTNMNVELPVSYFYEKYGMMECKDILGRMSAEFTDELRNIRELSYFWKPYNKDYENINVNRQRMNYSLDEYDRIFRNIFKDIDRKKVVLFGSGIFSKHFIAMYKNEVDIECIVDNNSSKWGGCLEGIEIKSPDAIFNIEEDRRIIICIKQYMAIVKQLNSMGIDDYVIYDKGMTYERPVKKEVRENEGAVSKRYKRGYIAGVFDMFHRGHLNLIKRAKEQCEYLIVGVVADESVRTNKKVEPVISFEDRLEIVRACKYVDEAVEIPVGYADTQEAYRMYQFDVQFSGSDYRNDPGWLAKKAYLESKGVEMVFFPYTESVSSSKLKQKLGK